MELLHERVGQLSSLLSANGIDVPQMEAEKRNMLMNILEALELEGTAQYLGNSSSAVAPPKPVFDQPSYDLVDNQESSYPSIDLGGSMAPFSSEEVAQVFSSEEWGNNSGQYVMEETTPEWSWPSFDLSSMVQVPAGVGIPPPYLPQTNKDGLPAPARQSRRPSAAIGPNHSSDDEADAELINDLSARMGSLRVAPDGRLRYYGTATNLHLLDHPAQEDITEIRNVRQDGKQILDAAGVGREVDPSFEQHLIDLYFTWHDPCFHIVDREMYESAKKSWKDEENDYYSEVLTNAMSVYVHFILVQAHF